MRMNSPVAGFARRSDAGIRNGFKPDIGERQGVSPPSQATEFLACVCELKWESRIRVLIDLNGNFSEG